MTMVTTCSIGMRAPRISTGRLRLGHSVIDFGRLEYNINRKFRIENPRAKDAIIIVAGLALRKRRNTITSDNTERPAPISSSSGTRRENGRLAANTPAAALVDGHSNAEMHKARRPPLA